MGRRSEIAREWRGQNLVDVVVVVVVVVVDNQTEGKLHGEGARYI